jgi:magnesium-transporting ATPase (P-type)
MRLLRDRQKKIRDLCTGESMPDDFDIILDSLTFDGFRVIAFGSKEIDESEANNRGFIESNLTF